MVDWDVPFVPLLEVLLLPDDSGFFEPLIPEVELDAPLLPVALPDDPPVIPEVEPDAPLLLVALPDDPPVIPEEEPDVPLFPAVEPDDLLLPKVLSAADEPDAPLFPAVEPDGLPVPKVVSAAEEPDVPLAPDFFLSSDFSVADPDIPDVLFLRAAAAASSPVAASAPDGLLCVWANATPALPNVEIRTAIKSFFM